MRDTEMEATGTVAEQNAPTPARPVLWPAVGERRHLLVVIGLGAMVFLTYANSFRTGFALDNKFLILEDPRLREATNKNLKLIFTQDYWYPKAISGLYRPLTTLSYMLNYAVLGNRDHSAGYHAINFMLHWGNAVLVYFAALVVLKQLWPAIFTAALFGAHPIATESVTNIIGRADLFATAAVLGGFLLYAKSATEQDMRKLPWLFGLMAVTALGLFCKESTVVLLGVMVLYDFTYRLQSRDSNWLANLGRNAWEFLCWGYNFVLLPMAAWWWVRSALFARMRPAELPFVDNPLKYSGDSSLLLWFIQSRVTAVKVIGKYFGLLIWPGTLSCDYSYNQIPLVGSPSSEWEQWKTVITLVAVLAVAVLAVRSYRHDKAAFFFAMFFFVTLLPTSNLIKIIGSIMAERFLYLPSLGCVGFVVALVYAACQQSFARPHIVAGLILSIAVVACSARAFVRNVDWTDDMHLWTQAVAACPNSFKTHKSLAYARYETDPQAKRIDQVIDEGEKALDVMESRPLRDIQKPSIVPLHLGVYYRVKGDTLSQRLPEANLVTTNDSRLWYEKSADMLRRAVPLDAAFNEETHNRELLRGKPPEQIPDVGNQEIYANLGLAYMRLGEYDRAFEAYRYMRHLAPTDPAAYLAIGTAVLSAGKADEAAVALSQALLLDSNRKDALALLAEIYRQADPKGCALRGPPDAPQLDADCPLVRTHLCSAYYGMVQVFLECKQPSVARQFKQSALQNNLCPREPFDQILPEPGPR